MFSKKNGGFTLIELLVVIAIIGILASISVPRLTSAIDRARESSIRGNMSGLRSALEMYHVDNRGQYPEPVDDKIPDDALVETFSEIPRSPYGDLPYYNTNDDNTEYLIAYEYRGSGNVEGHGGPYWLVWVSDRSRFFRIEGDNPPTYDNFDPEDCLDHEDD